MNKTLTGYSDSIGIQDRRHVNTTLISCSPASSLVNSLCNEVTGKTVLKVSLVFKRVVTLCVGHASTLKPAVKHLCHSLQHTLPCLGGDGQWINTVNTTVSELKIERDLINGLWINKYTMQGQIWDSKRFSFTHLLSKSMYTGKITYRVEAKTERNLIHGNWIYTSKIK